MLRLLFVYTYRRKLFKKSVRGWHRSDRDEAEEKEN